MREVNEMNNVYENIRQMIGNTPILKISHMGVKPGVNIYAKLELMNPAGSVKDRVGVYMIDDARKRGILKEGGTIVDATAGNTGIGIAVAALPYLAAQSIKRSSDHFELAGIVHGLIMALLVFTAF